MKWRTILLGAALCLGMFYLYVFSVMLVPDVSDEYRRYYITREGGLTQQEREMLVAVHPGEELGFDTSKLGFDGWSLAEADFRWSLGENPRLHFILQDAKDAAAIATIVLQVRPLGEQRVRIFINEKALGERRLQSVESAEIIIPLADNILHEGENTLRLQLPDARRPGNGDPRELGLALFSFTLARA